MRSFGFKLLTGFRLGGGRWRLGVGISLMLAVSIQGFRVWDPGFPLLAWGLGLGAFCVGCGELEIAFAASG